MRLQFRIVHKIALFKPIVLMRPDLLDVHPSVQLTVFPHQRDFVRSATVYVKMALLLVLLLQRLSAPIHLILLASTYSKDVPIHYVRVPPPQPNALLTVN